MARREPHYILENFTNFLSDNVEGFGELPWMYQFNFAVIAFKVLNKRHEHSKYQGFASIGYQELRIKFGRQFIEINKKLGLFDVTDDWSKRDKYTRGVKLTDKMQTMLTAFLESDPRLSKLIDISGAYMKSIPQNMFENSVNASFKKNTRKKATVPINHPELMHIIKYMDAIKNTPNILDVEAILKEARMVNHYSRTAVPGIRSLNLRYGETKTGRLQGTGVYHLQGVRNIITDACLHGLPKYDVDNCHWAIISAFTHRIGIQCPAVDNYLENKKAIREQIARDIGIDIKIVKICIIALLYGAKMSEWHKTAIPKVIIAKGKPHEIPYKEGIEKVRALYCHPAYSAIAKEVEVIRPQIIEQWPNKSRQKIYNEVGKRINIDEDERSVMACLLQGAEAAMMNISLKSYPGEHALLKFDGFTTFTEIDTSLMISKIQEELGITITMSTDYHKNPYLLPEAKKITPVKKGPKYPRTHRADTPHQPPPNKENNTTPPIN